MNQPTVVYDTSEIEMSDRDWSKVDKFSCVLGSVTYDQEENEVCIKLIPVSQVDLYKETL